MNLLNVNENSSTTGCLKQAESVHIVPILECIGYQYTTFGWNTVAKLDRIGSGKSEWNIMSRNVCDVIQDSHYSENS